MSAPQEYVIDDLRRSTISSDAPGQSARRLLDPISSENNWIDAMRLHESIELTIYADESEEDVRRTQIRARSISSVMPVEFFVCSLPTIHKPYGVSSSSMLETISSFCSEQKADIAKLLHVSRPTIYKIESGEQISERVRRRLLLLAGICQNYIARGLTTISSVIKDRQSDGSSLFDILSAEEIDTEALDQLLCQYTTSDDFFVRLRLAAALSRPAPIHTRTEILEPRQRCGKMTYVGDTDDPTKLIQIAPDGARSRGRMIDREFVPDEE